MAYIFSGCIFLGWLVPNHYFPWLSAWNEAISIAGLLLFAIFSLRTSGPSPSTSRPIACFFALTAALPWLQLATGHLFFMGDAVMVSLYAALGLLAVCLGHRLSPNQYQQPNGELRAFTSACAIAAILSTGVALVQWTSALSLGIYGAELPPGSRPFGNVAQPNHLNTLCFMGLCALFWLYEQRQLNRTSFWIGALFLVCGMLLSQSRTGWLQIGLLVTWGCIQSLRMRGRITVIWLVLLGSVFALGVVLWQPLNELLLLNPGRDFSSQMHSGTRPAYWLTMLDAISRQPWWGYGWQQIGSAQQAVALSHPPSIEYFEHSHNLILDFVLWNGLPIGLLLTGLLAWWLYQHIRGYESPATGWLLLALMGLGLHGLLEYPLEYAYFLIPAGLLIGCIEASTSQTSQRLVRIPKPLFTTGIAITSLAAALVATDWLSAEANYRTLRFESARIGMQAIPSEAPSLRLLTQLQAFLQFARTEATPNMAAEQLEWMRQVSQRFGYPPVLFRYALAAGLNDFPEEAGKSLARICRIYGDGARCTEAREGWIQLQQRYPQLQPITAP